MYAKDKSSKQVEKPNSSMMNRVVYSINDNRLMFKPLSKLKKINYKTFLDPEWGECSISAINKIYNKYNRQYRNIKDEDMYHGSSATVIKNQMINEMLLIEPDINKIITSLIIYLYKKDSSRKKKLLWFAFGETIYNNMCNNLASGKGICWGCGKRTKKKLVYNKCFDCRCKEAKLLNGNKLIHCERCGKEILLPVSSHIRLCEDCRTINKKDSNKINYNNRN